MQRQYLRGSLFVLLLVHGLTAPSFAQNGQKWQRVLIETPKPYDAVVRAVETAGGKVTQQFTYVDAIAAEVVEDSVQALSLLPGVKAISSDAEIQNPAVVNPTRARTAGSNAKVITSESSAPLSRILSRDLPSLAINHPEVYEINNAGTNIERLHALGFTGQGIIVAVIDSGVRNGYKLVDDTVIGGFDFVDDGAPGPGGDSQTDWKKEGNDGHGTFAAGLIAGKSSFVPKGVMKDALERYAPGALVDGKLPLIGTAPDAKIYVVRVFGTTATAGATVSTILAAIQHVIDQRVLYDTSGGRYGVKISVANLSLGVSTLAAGQTLLDMSVDRMLSAGIVPVVAGGNVGPSAMTASSPGSARSSVTVGGSSHATSERIMNEVFYGTESPGEYYPGIGGDIRPFGGTQVAWFSSRGPHADGRMDPDIVASSVGNISQGYCPGDILDACAKRLSIASGTSFSAPIVTGIAATLLQAFPNVGATRIRNALTLTGQSSQIANYFGEMDRGRGLVDAYAAYSLLATNTVPDALPPFTTPWDLPVETNIEQNPGIVVKSGNVTKVMNGLLPGARGEVFYDVPPQTERVIVRVSNVEIPGPENVVQGDGLFLYVHTAKTSSIGALGDYRVDGELFVGGEGETTFDVINPDTGIMRITLNPDTLNAGAINATVSIQTIPEGSTHYTRVINDTINHQQIKTFTHEVAPGTTRLDFLLTWDHDWARYPTSDVDVIVCSPAILAADCRALGNKKGATLAAPERVTIDNPAAGTWTLLVHGFNVLTQTQSDNFRLRIKATP
jgi:hypothetical protein